MRSRFGNKISQQPLVGLWDLGPPTREREHEHDHDDDDDVFVVFLRAVSGFQAIALLLLNAWVPNVRLATGWFTKPVAPCGLLCVFFIGTKRSLGFFSPCELVPSCLFQPRGCHLWGERINNIVDRHLIGLTWSSSFFGWNQERASQEIAEQKDDKNRAKEPCHKSGREDTTRISLWQPLTPN